MHDVGHSTRHAQGGEGLETSRGVNQIDVELPYRGILIRVELALAPAEDVEGDVPEAWSKATCDEQDAGL